ncbi:MAG: hypothetical protein K1X88_02620 [Nannocystaceae bacterium]|nr:hypothetical protein [Nannocystaceae bacterium]
MVCPWRALAALVITSAACATASDPGRDSAGEIGQGSASSDDGTTAAATHGTGTGSEGMQNCVPGQQIACACPGGSDGAQACLPDGGGYGPCECPDDGSTGAADSSGGTTAAVTTTGDGSSSTGGDACETCVLTSTMMACATEYQECLADPECAMALQCLGDCGYTLTCAMSCGEGIGMISGQVYGALVNCAALQCPRCAN